MRKRGQNCSLTSAGWLGTGPFFGGKTSLAKKTLAENMDLSPSSPPENSSDPNGTAACGARV